MNESSPCVPLASSQQNHFILACNTSFSATAVLVSKMYHVKFEYVGVLQKRLRSQREVLALQR